MQVHKVKPRVQVLNKFRVKYGDILTREVSDKKPLSVQRFSMRIVGMRGMTDGIYS